MRLAIMEVQLEAPWISNPVFSSDGERVFGLTSSGELWSVIVPRDGGPPVVPNREQVTAGRVVAVDCLEGRLATIEVDGGALVVSHALAGWNLGPSFPARVPLDQTQARCSSKGRLGPYLRWRREIDPMTSAFVDMSLLRDDDDQLHSIFAWREPHGIECRARDVGLAVSAIAAVPGTSALAAAGIRNFSPRTTVGKGSGRSTVQSGIFLLARATGEDPELILPLGPETRAFFGFAGPRDADRERVSVAVGDGSRWSLLWLTVSAMPDISATEWVQTAEDVVGVVAGAGQPFLVIRDRSGQALSLVGPTQRIPFASTSRRILAVATSTASPAIAWTDERSLGFAVPAGD